MRRLSLLALVLLAAPVFAQSGTPFDPDTVRAYPLDNGKMWLFEDPPTEYLAETYGFEPDAEWFERARLAALRLPNCSASFVSPHGLVATNHHCVQGNVVAVSESGEGLLDAGFSARSRAEERRVPGLYVDQLVEIVDATDEVAGGADPEAIAARLLAARGVADPDADDAPFVVQTVALYDGGRTSAYVFRRHRDVRLVFAPEARLGYFGGDFDNFTYPRYALDFAFLRVYGPDGRPLASDHFFPLSAEGVREGSEVFVIGNPGRTNRGYTAARLEFTRDVDLPTTLQFIDSRAAALQALLASGVDDPDPVRSQLFSLLNSQKAIGGRLRGLRDPYILARRRAAEADFVGSSADARGLVDEMAALQAQKTALAPSYRAFRFAFNGRYGSGLLARALAAATGREPNAGPLAPTEEAFLTAELEAFRSYYEATGEPMPKVLQGGAPEAARFLLESSAYAREAPPASGADDPAVMLVREVLPRIQAFGERFNELSEQEAEVASRLGQARYAAFGNAVPPDATFSLRFTDGVVSGYGYNGTVAPPVTTLFGLYDHHYSYCEAGQGSVSAGDCDWGLPASWLAARSRVDLATPVNFTSTSDTIGGNSGSPVVDRDLRLVGLNFDRTIEGLVRDYLYAPERGRNVMVDTRVVLEALREVYGLPALADELTGG